MYICKKNIMTQITIDYEEYQNLLKYKKALQENKVLECFRNSVAGCSYEVVYIGEKDHLIMKLNNEIKELKSELNKANEKKGFFSFLTH